MRVSGLFRYPVKSLGGEAVAHTPIEPRGLAGDRRWMLVDAAGRFLTRREVPDMALLDASAAEGGIVIRHPALGSCTATMAGKDAPRIEGTVWRDRVTLRLGNPAADAFLSAALGRAVRLGWQPDDSIRPIPRAWSRAGDHVSLANGFPVLVTTTASLAVLNERLAAPVEMARFRANIVVEGAALFAEDRWQTIRIGDVTLQLGRACTRCVVVTQQAGTGERRDGNEPLSTLRAMGRATREGVTFGINMIPRTHGILRTGDPVTVVGNGAPD